MVGEDFPGEVRLNVVWQGRNWTHPTSGTVVLILCHGRCPINIPDMDYVILKGRNSFVCFICQALSESMEVGFATLKLTENHGVRLCSAFRLG